MKKNDIFELEITDMGTDGEGIGHYDGMTFFVKDALIGDVITARVTKLKKNYGYARVEEIKTPSTFRIEPKCALHKRCGGCQIQALSYEKQLEFKNDKVRNNLMRIGGFSEDELSAKMAPPVGIDNPYRYRNKAQFPVGRDKDGNIITGFYASRSHNIIPVDDCMLGVPVNKEILDIIKAWMNEYGIEPYDEVSRTGLVRHVLIRYGFTSKQIMVCLVINGDGLDSKRRGENVNVSCVASGKITDKRDRDRESYNKANDSKVSCNKANDSKASDNKPCDSKASDSRYNATDTLCERLSKIDGMTSISYNINKENTNVILGKKTVCIWGRSYIEDTIHLLSYPDFTPQGTGITYQISPQSFYQVNPKQTEKLYSTALEFAGLTGKESVWDLYCGIGTISLFLSQRAKKVYGVEIVPQAIDDAKNNAKINGITNAEFFVGKAEEVLPEFYADAKKNITKGSEAIKPEVPAAKYTDEADMLTPDVIVVDPPRKGCDEKCLDTMLKMEPQRIVYVSCDSATLARDLKILCEEKYELVKWQAFDQFSHTGHVETVCLLSKLHEAKHHVSVTLDMDEMDLTAAESKATYEEIKKYVAEHNDGMKVSNLYIAQVKAKYGIIERENYNLPKSGDAKQPQCPKEKEDAIADALRFFRMI
ncbi:MAG: class I SAM-dependent RNA methyltransferase [Lachnospiraceae bacterium]|nr:class I SAM-dependent RNA methyltransferase [Lachnospiraceae bacterium]